MIRAVADTHALIWYVWGDPRLPATVRDFVEAIHWAEGEIAISSISLVEVVYLIEKRRIDPGTLALILELMELGELFVESPIDQLLLPSLAAIPRAQIPDMPDRIIAATALHLGVPLISRDARIRASAVETIW